MINNHVIGERALNEQAVTKKFDMYENLTDLHNYDSTNINKSNYTNSVMFRNIFNIK